MTTPLTGRLVFGFPRFLKVSFQSERDTDIVNFFAVVQDICITVVRVFLFDRVK